MKKLLLHSIILLFTFHVSQFTVIAQTTEPILRINSQMHNDGITKIDTDVAGKYLLTVSVDKTAKLWDATTGDLLKTFRPPIDHGKEGMLFATALSPSGKIAAVTGVTGLEWDRKIYIYLFNTTTGQLIQRLTVLDKGITGITGINDLEFSIDGNYLAAALTDVEGVVIYKTNLQSLDDMSNLNVSKFKILTGYGAQSKNLTFDYTGRFATVCYDGKIRLYDNSFKHIEGNNRVWKISIIHCLFSPRG